jgi:iron complex outermembrane recepter protein
MSAVSFRLSRYAGGWGTCLVLTALGSTSLTYATPTPTPADQPAAETAASDQGNSLSEIVVTAQRREQRLVDVPISVEAQTGEQLERRGVVDLQSLPIVSPEVSFQQNYSKIATSFAIRGVQSINANGGVQPSVAVVMDDVPFARPGEAVMSLADIDHIEVLSGPQGTLFGKNATGGVINIVQNRPKFQFESSFEQTGTTDGELLTRGLVNLPLSDKVALRVNAFYDNLPPLVKNFSGPDIDGQRDWGVQAKVLWQLTDDSNLQVGASYNHWHDSWGALLVIVPNSGPLGVLQRQYINVFSDSNQTINQNELSADIGRGAAFTAQFESALTQRLNLKVIAGYRSWNSRSYSDVDSGPTGVEAGVGFTPGSAGYPINNISASVPHQDVYRYGSIEGRLTYSAPGLDIVGGAFFQGYRDQQSFHEGYIFDGSFVIGPSAAGTKFISDQIYRGRTSDPTGAVFLDVTKEVASNIKVFGGLRGTYEKVIVDYDSVNWFNPVDGFFDPVTLVNSAPPSSTYAFNGDSISEKNVSGRAGVQWQPAPDTNYYLSYNRGYKGPAVNISGGLTTASGVLLKPEIANAVEIGVKRRFLDDRLAADLAVYHQEVENIQQTGVINGGTNLNTTLINAGTLKTDGFDLSLTGRASRDLNLSGAVVYNHARYGGNLTYFPCGPSAIPGAGSCLPNGLFPLNGQQAIGTPTWKNVNSANYEHLLNDSWKVFGTLAFTWQSSIQYQLYSDPLTRQGSYGLLDASVGVGSADDHWRIRVFGKNLTDKFHYGALNTADNFIGEEFNQLTRDFHRYFGVTASVRY